MIDLYPRKCNLCGGDVIYTSNSRIYGREYGSGKCYYCTKCHAYVGTHKPEPRKALGLLANPEMRRWSTVNGLYALVAAVLLITTTEPMVRSALDAEQR